MFGLKCVDVPRRPQKHSQIERPYESKPSPSPHPTEPQYCRRILPILLFPLPGPNLYPSRVLLVSNNQIYCDTAKIKSGALLSRAAGSSWFTSRDFEAFGVSALVHHPPP